MNTSITRRSLTIGLGALAAAGTTLLACGGGGGGNGASPDSGGAGNPPSGGGGSGSGLSGSFWYQDNGDLIKVGSGGAATPVAVGKILGPRNGVSSWFPRISRNSSRYLQLGQIGATTDSSTAVQCFDHASHTAYCDFELNGFSSDVFVSPSGNFVSALRSPELVKTIAYAGPNSIVGLTIIDISDANNLRAVREAYLNGPKAVVLFNWLDGDRFIYIAYDRTIVTGSASAGAQQDQVLGRFDDQGKGLGGLDVHPDGSTMLVKLNGSNDTSDIYLYTTSGTPIDRMTAVDLAYAPMWSPDGRHFSFKRGSPLGCSPATCTGTSGSTCTGFYAPSSARSVTSSQASQFDGLKVPCRKEAYWSAID
jgi:hypothetical protein